MAAGDEEVRNVIAAQDRVPFLARDAALEEAHDGLHSGGMVGHERKLHGIRHDLAAEARDIPAGVQVGEHHVVVLDSALQEAQPARIPAPSFRQNRTHHRRPRAAEQQCGESGGESVLEDSSPPESRQALLQCNGGVAQSHLEQQRRMREQPSVAPLAGEPAVRH